jgi:hypothetical protein
MSVMGRLVEMRDQDEGGYDDVVSAQRHTHASMQHGAHLMYAFEHSHTPNEFGDESLR